MLQASPTKRVSALDGFDLCLIADSGFDDTVGPLYMRRTDSGLRFAFVAEQKHTNGRGIVHGGMLMTFADQILGITVQQTLGIKDVVTISLNCDFVAAATVGDVIEGEAKVLRVTRTLVFIEGLVCRGETVILNANGIWMRRDRRTSRSV